MVMIFSQVLSAAHSKSKSFTASYSLLKANGGTKIILVVGTGSKKMEVLPKMKV
jgi:hypothetical protein